MFHFLVEVKVITPVKQYKNKKHRFNKNGNSNTDKIN